MLHRRPLLAPVGAVVVVAAAVMSVPSGGDSERAAAADVELAAAPSQPEPVRQTVPTTHPPDLDDLESMCPGLALDAELIPPHVETQITLVRDPDTFEICLQLAHEGG